MILVQLSDPHVVADGRLAYGVADTVAMLHAAVDTIGGLDPAPDAVLVTGDLVDRGESAEYEVLRHVLARLPVPVHLVVGNHDDRDALRDVFPDWPELHVGGPFVQYVTDHGPIRLVVLDSHVPGEPGGRLCPDRLAWLDDVLARERDRPTVLAVHHPPFRTGIAHMDAMALDDPAGLAAVVARHGQVERVLCGHLHRPIHARFAGTIASTAPSPAHQVALDLDPEAPAAFTLEPPGLAVHTWIPGTGLVSHQVPVGRWGRHPFA